MPEFKPIDRGQARDAAAEIFDGMVDVSGDPRRLDEIARAMREHNGNPALRRKEHIIGSVAVESANTIPSQDRIPE